MISLKRLSLLIILPAVLMLLVAACGDDDPTATSPSAEPTVDEPADEPPADEPPADEPPADEPPAEEPPEEVPALQAIACPDPCVQADNFSVEDGKFEFRIGDDGDLNHKGEPLNPDGLFGFPLGARVPSIIPGGIVIGPMLVGTTFQFGTIRMSGSRSTKDHYFIVRGLESQCQPDRPESVCTDGPDIFYPYSLDGTRVEEPWSYTFNVAGTWPIISATADGDDPPEEHGMAVFLICDEIDAAGTGCVGGGEPAAFDGRYLLGDFVVEDDKFELRMGATPYFGYDADPARVPTIAGLVEIVLGPIQVGETIVFDRCRQSGSRSTKPHHLTIELAGIDINLDGAFDTGGASVGESDNPDSNCEFSFDAPGVYIIDDSTDPGAHGVAKIIVEGEAMAAAGVVYTLDEIKVRDDLFEFRIGETAEFGYDAGTRVSTGDGDVTITINLGDSLVFPDGITSSSGVTTPHKFTIDGLGVDIDSLPDVDTEPGFTIAPTEAGSYLIYCSLHPDGHGGALTIVVKDGGDAVMAGPVVYTLNEFNLEDGKIELRMGDTTAWGYNAGDTLFSDEVEIVITINVGDSIVLTDGFNVSSSRSTKDHHFTITELGIDVLGVVGERDIMPGFTITPTEAGTFIIHDSSDPDGHGNPITLVVN